MKSPPNRHAAVMSLLIGLFSLRVAGQAVQHWLPQDWLPEFGEFQGSGLPYSGLLTLQLLILVVMARTCVRISGRTSTPSRSQGVGLVWFGGVYMLGSIARIAVGIGLPAAPDWFTAWMPAFFHLILAAFVLTAAHFHLTGKAAS
jgi:hypothetical protein